MTSEIYLLERVLHESIQVAVVGSTWGFGDKMDGTVIDCIQFSEQSVVGYFVNDIAEVEDRQDSQFYEGMFGIMSEGGFVVKQEADSRFHFGLEVLSMSLEGDKKQKHTSQTDKSLSYSITRLHGSCY